jgi:hypothetical protein
LVLITAQPPRVFGLFGHFDERSAEKYDGN